jgi:drug/metabolite transporter (DMT)-like permease
MKREKKLNLIGQGLLLAATIVWGTSFFILKETISTLPTFYVIAIRFVTAGIGLSLIFIKKLKTIKKSTFLRGMILGVFLALAYFTQTIGLENTTPGQNAFLTSSYCVMCPFMVWILFKKRPKFYNVFSAVLCIVGIGFIALSNGTSGGGNWLLGNGLTLVSAVFFGLQIIFIDKFSKEGHDNIQLLIPEILTAGAIMTVYTLCVEMPIYGVQSFSLNGEQIWKIAYLTVMCTLFAQSAQIIGQKYTTTNQSSIILSLESVFGTLFSVLFAGEQLTALIIVGFVIVFTAMIITELKLDPMKLFLRRRSEKIDAKEQEIKEKD